MLWGCLINFLIHLHLLSITVVDFLVPFFYFLTLELQKIIDFIVLHTFLFKFDIGSIFITWLLRSDIASWSFNQSWILNIPSLRLIIEYKFYLLALLKWHIFIIRSINNFFLNKHLLFLHWHRLYTKFSIVHKSKLSLSCHDLFLTRSKDWLIKLCIWWIYILCFCT